MVYSLLYTTFPTYPSGQIGFVIVTKGGEGINVPVRKLSSKVKSSVRYYTPELHSASFVFPAFAKRQIMGTDPWLPQLFNLLE